MIEEEYSNLFQTGVTKELLGVKMIDDNRLIIRSEFMDRNSLRVNKLKLIPADDFVNVYIDSGKTKDGGSKYGNIRLEKHQIKELISYLNDLELK